MTIVKTPASDRSRTLRYLPLLCLVPALLLAAPCAMAQPETGASLPAGTPDAPSGTEGTALTFSYQWLAGSTFHPVSTPGSYTYGGAGCIYPSATGAPLFHHKLLLPEGSLVKYVRMYYRNGSASNAPTAFFTTYDMTGGFNERMTVSGPTTSGYGFIVSGELSYVVDPFAEPINIAVNLGSVTDGSVQFCGVRVAYYAPLPPEIFMDGFE